jgi:hypothetical protein
VEDSQIERSGSQEAAKMSLSLSERELSMLWLALDGTTTDAERDLAASRFFKSLRNRGVTGSEFEPLLEPEVTLIVYRNHVSVHHGAKYEHRGVHELLVSYVLDQLLGVQGIELMDHLRSQFMSQCQAKYRI